MDTQLVLVKPGPELGCLAVVAVPSGLCSSLYSSLPNESSSNPPLLCTDSLTAVIRDAVRNRRTTPNPLGLF